LPSEKCTDEELREKFEKHGKILGKNLDLQAFAGLGNPLLGFAGLSKPLLGFTHFLQAFRA
jgi:hypothetical protein